MIPDNINGAHVLEAIKMIERDGVPRERQSTKYNLQFDGRLYPPKYVISIANRFANGVELQPSLFSGGVETNLVLQRLGFTVLEGARPGEATPGPVQQLTNLEPLSVKVTTVLVSEFSKQTRRSREESIRHAIDRVGSDNHVILFPAGYYDAGWLPAASMYRAVGRTISQMLNECRSDAIVVVGVDGRRSADQVALAVGKDGIVGAARKFHPTEEERTSLKAASDHLATEAGYPRIIEVNGKKLYLAVCYDVFGVRHRALTNPGVDGVLGLVHEFTPPGTPGSGSFYFVRDGLGGASKQWACPVFGSVIFSNCDVPPRLPSAVTWTLGESETKYWKYDDNPMSPVKGEVYKHISGYDLLRQFVI